MLGRVLKPPLRVIRSRTGLHSADFEYGFRRKDWVKEAVCDQSGRLVLGLWRSSLSGD
jgi:hypothetical protein